MPPGRKKETVRAEVAGWLLLAASCASAQVIPSPADWQEADAPAPPPLTMQGLLPLEMGTGTELRWGVDPASIQVGRDGVVRYVVVGQGAGGAVNAYYEGLRCSTGEVKLYARYAGDKWVSSTGADWKPLDNRNAASRHSLAIARNGACIRQGPNRSPADIARDLGRGTDSRFRPEYR